MSLLGAGAFLIGFWAFSVGDSFDPSVPAAELLEGPPRHADTGKLLAESAGLDDAFFTTPDLT